MVFHRGSPMKMPKTVLAAGLVVVVLLLGTANVAMMNATQEAAWPTDASEGA